MISATLDGRRSLNSAFKAGPQCSIRSTRQRYYGFVSGRHFLIARCQELRPFRREGMPLTF